MEGANLASRGTFGGWSALLQTAIQKHEEALSLYRSIGDNSKDGQILFCIGEVWSYLDDNEKAVEFYHQARRFAEITGAAQLEADIFSRLGVAYSELGKKQDALDYSLRALHFFQRMKDKTREAFSLYNLAVIYYSIGSIQRSLQCVEESLAISRQQEDSRAVSYALLWLGTIYSDTGENQKAIDYLHQSLTLSRQIGHRRVQALALSELGRAQTIANDPEDALTTLQTALALSREVAMSSVEARTLNNLGTTLNVLRKNEDALESFQQALIKARTIRDPDIEIEALYGIGRAQRDVGRFANSKQALEAAILQVDSIRTRIGRSDFRLAYFASAQEIYDLYIDVLMQMHRQQPLKGFATLAFQASESVRARNLREMLTASQIDIRRGIDPSLRKREAELQESVKTMALRQMRSKNSTEPAANFEKSLESLLSQFEDVQAEIKLKNPNYAALTNPPSLTAEDIQRSVLDDDTLLLEYALGEDRSFLWAVTKDAIRSYELPQRSTIEAEVQKVLQIIKSLPGMAPESRTANEKAYLAAASGLSKMLLATALSDFDKKRLLIVSQGALQLLPFGALPIPTSSGQTADVRPLVVKHEIVYAPSASLIAILRQEIKNREVPSKVVAVFADPVFEKNDYRLSTGKKSGSAQKPAHSYLRSAVDMDNLTLLRLPYTRFEAENIARLIPVDQRLTALDFNASRQTVMNGKLDQYRIVHFATHAVINNSHPELSGILLSLVDKTGTPQDGFLNLNDIFNLKLSADLVVLSGCRTGLGKDVRGEGMVGLTRGFMYAGSSRVVASLWNTDDRSTATLMTRFYSRMFDNGLKPAAALRAAQLEMWQEQGWRNPYFWAAFVLQGDW
jgi:CHAT domain-containing protein/Tfp pilus assembly protein PilF